MRKQDKIIVWPSYFDATKKRKEGRRVSKSFAVPSPKVQEIKDAADRLGFETELVGDAGYSKTPWMKTGMVLVKKREAKDQMLRKIARQLLKMRSAAQPK